MYLEDGDKFLGDLVFLSLSDTLSNPFDVADLLLLQLEVSIEDAIVELLLEGELAKPHLLLVEEIFKSLSPVFPIPSIVVQLPPLGVVVQGSTNIVSIGSLSQELDTIRVKVTKVAVQPRSVIRGELSVERVDGDGDGSTVGLEFEDLAHDLSSLTTLELAVMVEVLQISLVEGVTDDFNVQLAQITLGGDTLLEVRGKGGLDHEPLVTVFNGGVDGEGSHTFESTKGMGLLNQLFWGTVVHSTRNEEDGVVNHVRVAEVIQIVGERDDGRVLDVVELDGHSLCALFNDDGCLQRVGGIGKEITIGGGSKMELHIFQLLALHQVVVVSLGQQSTTESTGKSLEVSITDIEVKTGSWDHRIQPISQVANLCHFFLS
mmetsp:Transcript_34934/g.54445  ORF Transcript_34934/g.54445 Transcript_34934/m.54445 type:complete len:375 (+) Transcript_34934:166-1290(+)